ncbi:outer membrane lipoprotein carrier protein LolA [Flavobacteriaceae bacterium]|nr:outer membrane lipoprotein carrier protein LolA [Flavobacteriaceae bacterium]MDA9015516.1 outer membrane lipoprotein carrier protein LolA [Flavobacteriaceae bacterium]MDB3862391.1 outer membrane lipoprotein carrier protein LolA [Flavobacteriaceae bacterium]MDC3354359.1 outer membrane lipoprotein carrier protein LolA [Flavobacteriaceae bacterium]
MRFSFIFLFSILLYGVQSNAQDTEAAKNLLEQVSEKIASFENMKFDFDYVLENRQENIKQETNGSVTVSGNRYKLLFLGAEQLFDGEKTYTIVPENEEITIENMEETDDIGINPSKLLYFYKEGYAFQWDIKQKVMGRTIQFIKLIPMDENKDVNYLLLGIDTLKKTIYRLIEIGANETRTTLTISNFKTNVNLAAKFFTFDPSLYKDYYINQ